MKLSKYLNTYLSHRPAFLAFIRSREASLFEEYLPLKSPIVDVGCGDGFFAKIVFGRVDIGLDIADSRIIEAQAYKKLIVYDGRKFPLASRSVSTAVSNCVLEHVEYLPEVISEAHRILKPGGKFLVTVMCLPWEKNLFGALAFGHSYKNWLRQKQVHVNLLTFSQWKKLFLKPGFKIIKTSGYLSPKACRLIEIFHYLGLPSLITYKLIGKWNLIPLSFLNNRIVRKIISEKVSPQDAGAVFFLLQK